MKISITKDSKRVITLEEVEQARKIIESEKENDSVNYYAEMAVDAAATLHGGDDCVKVLEASAEIAKNQRLWNFYHEESRDLDVWVRVTARTYRGFCIVGAYLSDIYQLTSDNKKEIAASHMFIRWFAET